MKNMECTNLNTWEEWIKESLELIEKRKEQGKEGSSPVVFRGQADSNWKLETTIERFLQKHNGIASNEFSLSIEQYNHYLKNILPFFNSCTGKKFSVADIGEDFNISIFFPPPNYEFVVYCRHIGFPSPLLDWTASPYVAAYFAFHDLDIGEKGKKVAIYTFQAVGSECGEAFPANGPMIVDCGPTIETHSRHLMQQGWYTYCKKKINSKWFYTTHEEFLNHQKISKYTIPAMERDKVLKQLDLMNVNQYTLFGNEEGLADMLAHRVIFKQHNN